MHRSLTTRFANAAALLLTLAACSSSPSTKAPAITETPTTTAPAATAPPAETPSTVIDPMVCATDKKTLEVASEAFQAQMGQPPADQQALVDSGFLREVIPEYVLQVTGDQVTVVAVAGTCN